MWGSEGRREKEANAPVFMPERFLKGESKSIATMPMLKICTPPPDMYSMNACMGSDLSGEIAKSQALRVLSASCEPNASAVVVAIAAAAAAAPEDLPLGALLPYKKKTETKPFRSK